VTAVWLDLAACAGHPVDLWRDHAYLFGEFEDCTGVYGGMTLRERRRAWRHLGHRYRPANAQGANH